MESIMSVESQLVGFAARRGLNIEIVVLICSTTRGGIDESFTIKRNIRSRPVQCLLREHRCC